MLPIPFNLPVDVPVQRLPQRQGTPKSIPAILWKPALAIAITYAVVMAVAGSAFLSTRYLTELLVYWAVFVAATYTIFILATISKSLWVVYYRLALFVVTCPLQVLSVCYATHHEFPKLANQSTAPVVITLATVVLVGFVLVAYLIDLLFALVTSEVTARGQDREAPGTSVPQEQELQDSPVARSGISQVSGDSWSQSTLQVPETETKNDLTKDLLRDLDIV